MEIIKSILIVCATVLAVSATVLVVIMIIEYIKGEL